MGKNTKKEQEQKVNFYELVSEARVKQIVEEEEQLVKENPEVKALIANTIFNLRTMEQMQQEIDELTACNDPEMQPYIDTLFTARRETRNEVVVDNLRLVTQVLKKYGYFNADKFQNGCIGLLKAAETYNFEKGVPFHNYAAFCIETEVRLAFRRVNRLFESKKKGFLESLDAPTTTGMDGDRQQDKYEEVSDECAIVEFDEFIAEAEVDTLFYDIIIPVIEEYGTRAKDIDMLTWRELEIQYFIELSMEQSQRQRITFTEMASQLNTTPQNIRARHKKVMQMVREACIDYGYSFYKSEKTGRVRFSFEDQDIHVKYRGKKHK